jgi:hypothetical protein
MILGMSKEDDLKKYRVLQLKNYRQKKENKSKNKKKPYSNRLIKKTFLLVYNF